ncbi:MAG: hypothetical protein H0W86_13085 [Armatimonadetes bacterium]|nr:hypothetical protein [Armatimonadota bacterium]
MVFDSTAPVQIPSSLVYTVESRTNVAGFTHTIDIWNWTTSSWDVIAVDSTASSDEVVSTDVTGSSVHYIQNGTRKVRSRSRWRGNGSPLVPTLRAGVDQVKWTVVP